MTTDMELQRLLEESLKDGPQTAPMASRAVVRGRLREVRQRPGWLVRERGVEYPRSRRGGSVRLAMIGVSLVALLGISFAIGSFGGRPSDLPVAPHFTVYPISGQPLGVALEGDAVWVGLFDQMSIARLDPAGGEASYISPVGRNCVSISGGAGYVWVPACRGAPMYRVDTQTSTAELVPGLPSGQTTAPVFDGGIAWITTEVYTGSFVRFDTTSGEILSRHELGGAGHIAAIAFGSAWAALTQEGRPYELLRLDLQTAEVQSSIPLDRVGDIAVTSSDALWLSLFDEASDEWQLVRIDPGTNEIVATIPFDSAIYPASDGTNVWVLQNDEPARLYRVDTETGAPSEPITIGGRADALAVDGETLWVTRGSGRDVVRIELDPR
jgi:streptogramin lyase